MVLKNSEFVSLRILGPVVLNVTSCQVVWQSTRTEILWITTWSSQHCWKARQGVCLYISTGIKTLRRRLWYRGLLFNKVKFFVSNRNIALQRRSLEMFLYPNKNWLPKIQLFLPYYSTAHHSYQFHYLHLWRRVGAISGSLLGRLDD